MTTLLLLLLLIPVVNASTRSFLFSPKANAKPQLILVAGCTGALFPLS